MIVILSCSVSVPVFAADRTQWFKEAKFGMFVHWGTYSQMGIEASWPLFQNLVPVWEYEALARTFNPVKFNADELVRMAVDAGMKYLIFTSKHHDGFAMFDTEFSDYSIMNTPYGKDIVQQVVDACHKAGIRVGFYFSLCDWHHPSYRDTSKPFPAGCKAEEYPEKTWDDFLVFMRGQLRELCTKYGKIDVIWFDGGWERTAEQWQSEEIDAMIRSLQPGILINNRHLLDEIADFGTPEQFVPVGKQKKLWESCMTINNTWAYNPRDHRHKSAKELVQNLSRTAGGGGNLLLNVGPKPDGTIQEEFSSRLDGIGTWMEQHSESIYGTSPAPVSLFREGVSTVRENSVYLHFLHGPDSPVNVTGLRTPVESAVVLGTGSRISIGREETSLTISVPYEDRNPCVTVVKLALSGEPEFDPIIKPDKTGIIVLPAWKADIWSGDISYVLRHRLISYSYSEDALIDWNNDADWAEWTCEIPQDGEYSVSIKYEGGISSLMLQVGNNEIALPVPSTNNVTAYRGQVFKTVHLSSGVQKVKVRSGETGEHISFGLREISFDFVP